MVKKCSSQLRGQANVDLARCVLCAVGGHKFNGSLQRKAGARSCNERIAGVAESGRRGGIHSQSTIYSCQCIGGRRCSRIGIKKDVPIAGNRVGDEQSLVSRWGGEAKLVIGAGWGRT